MLDSIVLYYYYIELNQVVKPSLTSLRLDRTVTRREILRRALNKWLNVQHI